MPKYHVSYEFLIDSKTEFSTDDLQRHASRFGYSIVRQHEPTVQNYRIISIEKVPENHTNLENLGYSTVKYLYDNFDEFKAYLEPIVKTSPNLVIRPCFKQFEADETLPARTMVRLMASNYAQDIAYPAVDQDGRIVYMSKHALTVRFPYHFDTTKLYETNESLYSALADKPKDE